MKTKRIRVIVDTNVFISALIGSETCREIYDAFEDGKFDLLLSPLLLREHVSVMQYKKLEAVLDTALKDRLLALLEEDAIKVFPMEKVSVCRDPKDNMVLECALIVIGC